jgi:DNA-binding transcriptional ArsR family regulator
MESLEKVKRKLLEYLGKNPDGIPLFDLYEKLKEFSQRDISYTLSILADEGLVESVYHEKEDGTSEFIWRLKKEKQ